MAGAQCSLVGRSSELGVLETALDDARFGRPRLVAVSGPEGIGKTALLRRFALGFPECAFVWVTAQEPDVRMGWSVLSRLLAVVRSQFGVLTECANKAVNAGSDPAQLGTLLAQLFVSLGAEAGQTLVIVLDNAHWVDPLSANAVIAALRHLEQVRFLTLLGVRAGSDAWASLPSDDDRVIRLGLRGLTSAGVAALAGNMGTPIGPWAARRLARHTAGNPLDVSALIEEVDQEVLAWGRGLLPAPRAVSAVLASALASCSAPAQALVGVVAVLGCPACLHDVATLAGDDSPLPAIQEAVQAGILKELAGTSRPSVAFVQPLFAVAAYYQLSLACRSELHSRAIALSTGNAALAHRVVLAQVSGCEVRATLATELAEMARSELEQGLLGPAATHYEMAADACGRCEERNGYLIAAGRARLDAGDAAGAEARLAETRLIPETVSPVLLGRLSLLGGYAGDARQNLEVAWAQGRRRDDYLATGKAASVLAVLAVHCGYPAEEARWFGEASEDGCEATKQLSAFIHYFALAIAGRTNEGLSLLNGSDMSSSGDPGLVLARGSLELFSDHFSTAQAYLDALISRRAKRGAHDQLRTHCLAFLAEAEYRVGAWDGAIAHAQEGALACEEAGRRWHAALTHAVAVRPLIARGDLKTATLHVAAANEIATRRPAALVVTAASRALAALEAARGNHAAALAALDAAESASGIVDPGVFGDGDARTMALLSLGRLGEAEEALCDLEAKAGTLSRRSALAQAARARARLEFARGDLTAVAVNLARAASYLDDLNMPFEDALLCLANGEALTADTRLVEAASEFERARRILTSLRAAPLLETCRGWLKSLASLRASGSAHAGLTPAEARVAQLAVAGLTNSEIAAQLYLNIKTVECHLGHTYAKLGISRRTQLHLHLNRGSFS